LSGVKRWSFGLAVVGSILCVGVLAPVVWFDSGGLPPFDATYFWMMIAPVIVVAVVLASEWNVRADRPSSIALIVIGTGIALYPMWGPPFWPSMTMPLGWIGTILSMYLPGLLIAAGGLLQLRLPSGQRLGRGYRSGGRSTS
jgi:hypothetical protein